tara:strand:- start:151 stop:552 length:402 start_codon:yes stop_codon:yes gene_type:complete
LSFKKKFTKKEKIMMIKISSSPSVPFLTAKSVGGNKRSAERAHQLGQLIAYTDALTWDDSLESFRKGLHHLKDLYKVMQTGYSAMCDDNCFEEKGSKGSPKWKHAVRCGLQNLKKQGLAWPTDERGVWYFPGK